MSVLREGVAQVARMQKFNVTKVMRSPDCGAFSGAQRIVKTVHNRRFHLLLVEETLSIELDIARLASRIERCRRRFRQITRHHRDLTQQSPKQLVKR